MTNQEKIVKLTQDMMSCADATQFAEEELGIDIRSGRFTATGLVIRVDGEEFEISVRKIA